ncbi:hypothetical protein GCM10009001_07310 [Virgibacillus siamensis]|uniref:Uncharacterized protein n=1 Tax=Virgibacillus siamensis TaxID=480071 RepID=A0ABP3QQG1_9BACI
MTGTMNKGSFFLTLIALVLSLNAIYASIYQLWSAAPPVFILLLIAIIAFVMGMKGLKGKQSSLAKWRGWFTLIMSFLLSVILLFLTAVNIMVEEPLKTVHSPDAAITIDFFTVNGGAATSISVKGIVNGPLWFTKKIYSDINMNKADVNWINNHTVKINNHTLNLNKGEIFSD